MEFAIRLFLSVLAAIGRRFLPAFLLTASVLTAGGGGIAALAGGSFWLGAKYALIACLAVGGLAAIITAFNAIKNGFN